MSITEAFYVARLHHQGGRLREAEQLYRQILALNPEHPDVLRLAGVVAHQLGDSARGIDLIRRAIAFHPASPMAQCNLGMVHAAIGQTDQAIAAFRRAIACDPDYADAYANLGQVLTEQGRFGEAIAACHQALELNPKLPEAANSLARALAGEGKYEEAIGALQQLVKEVPTYAEAYNNLGKIYFDLGRYDESIAACRRAILIKPALAEAHNNLGISLQKKGKTEEALTVLKNSLQLRPNNPATQHHFASALHAKHRHDEALVACKRALSLAPNDGQVHNAYANILRDVGKLDESIAMYRKAMELDPASAVIGSNLLFVLHCHPNVSANEIAQEHLAWSNRHAEPLRKLIRDHTNEPSPSRRLKIGYVSPDFRAHPVGRFLLPLLQQRNRDDFEVFCYFNGCIADAITQTIREAADRWVEVTSLSDEKLAERIRADAIDILVDLSGHTADNRLLVFARKPAPIQVSYLGYPNTSGLRTIDYRLTDHLADPTDDDAQFYPETRIRLPRTNWCFTAPPDSPPVGPAPHIRNGYITFASFNNFAKVSTAAVDLWATILREVPGSRLLLKSFPLSSPKVADNVRADFSSHGISAERLVLQGYQPGHASHLGAYGQVDIALDTFPYCGTTTTCDAMWMGVPVITLAGNTHVSRVGVSLLTNVGLQELIATDQDHYRRIAVELAQDPARIVNLRQNMRDRMKTSPLTDAKSFARDVESAYRRMWETWCTTRSPRA